MTSKRSCRLLRIVSHGLIGKVPMHATLDKSSVLIDIAKLARESRPNIPTYLTLVVYFSATSTQCLRLLPHLRQWQQRYASAGLGIVVAHIAQYAFEKNHAYLTGLSNVLDTAWPIAPQAVDPSQLWPQIQLVANDGTILHTALGTDACAGLEPLVRRSLTEAGARQVSPVGKDHLHQHRLGSQCLPSQPDCFAGSQRGRYKNTQQVNNGSLHLTDPLDMATFGLSLNGQWKMTDDCVRSAHQASEDAYLSFVFAGFEVSVVIEPLGTTPTTISLTLSGQTLRHNQAGSDVQINDGISTCEVATPRLYQLFQSQQYVAPADLRLRCTQGQIAVYLLSASGCRSHLDA